MGKGRRPLPARVKAARQGKPVTVTPSEAPECPAWLEPTAREEWERVAPELSRLGLLTRVDSTALAAYCQLLARWRECEKQVTDHGMLVEGCPGRTVLNPAAKHAENLLKQIRAYCAEFGFTPSARGRMELVAKLPPPPDEFDDFMETR